MSETAPSDPPHAADCCCRAHPLPASLGVREARDRYLAENGFSVDAYSSRWTGASFLGLPFWVPNTRRHAWAIMLHDLHHVATGYGTDQVSEGEISVWESRRPLRPLGLYTSAIVATGALLGWLLSPSRMRRARGAAGTDTLFNLAPDYDQLLVRTVGDLRALLGIPRDGLASAPRRLHSRAPRTGTNEIVRI